MKTHALAAIASGIVLIFSTSEAAPFFVGIYVVPPPEQPEIQVRIEFVDADDGSDLGAVTRHIDGSTYLKETITPQSTTKRVTIKFEPFDVKSYKVKPAERTVPLSPLMQAKTVTWLASVAADKAYLDNVVTAGSSLRKKDADGAISRAAYAGAVAETTNQRLEAARIEANGYLAKDEPTAALAVFNKIAQHGFDRADPSKKKVFVGEWLNVLEEAALAEGAAPDRNTGFVFGSLPSDSQLHEEFGVVLDAFAQVIPDFKEKISGVPKSDIAERERLVRLELATILRDLRRQRRK